MFETLDWINERPEPFQYYTTRDLWTDDYTSKQMLSFHLNESIDLSSRKAAFIDRSVDWIATRFDIGAHTRIVDFGCGPGLYTQRLAKRGACVTGIDFSERSIAHAKLVAAREQLDIRYVHQDYLEFETQARYDLILLIMCDFCALSPSQRKRLLGKFHKILKSDGAVLLDVYSLSAFEQREETAFYAVNLLDGFWSPNKYYGFLNTFKYAQEKVVLDKYTIIEPGSTRQLYNWLQYFDPRELESELVENGFEVKAIHSDVAGTPFDSEAIEFAVIFNQ